VKYIDYAIVASCTLAGLFVGQACEARVAVTSHATDSARAEGSSLPPMHATHIPDSGSGPIEKVRGFRVFQAGDCTVWRFQDSVGIHYLAEGRTPTYSTSGKYVACSVAR
jgi:hypothetical protein